MLPLGPGARMQQDAWTRGRARGRETQTRSRSDLELREEEARVFDGRGGAAHGEGRCRGPEPRQPSPPMDPAAGR